MAILDGVYVDNAVYVQALLKSKGVEQLSDYVNEKTPIRFKCTQCGKEHSILWSQIVQGINPDFICLDCSYANRSKSNSHTYSELQKIFEEKGSRLIVSGDVDLTQRVKTKSIVGFVCTYCGKETEMQYYSFKRGRNPNLRCPKCSRVKNGNYIAKKEIKCVPHVELKIKTFAYIKYIVESKGAVLLTDLEEYKDKNSYIRFKCSRCGNVHQIRWKKFEEGQNQSLLCEKCLPQKRDITLEFVRNEFTEKGVEVVSDSYVNSRTPIIFKCSQCGTATSIKWYNYTTGRNKYLLCDSCKKGNISGSPLRVAGTYSANGETRSLAEARSREFCKTFYNLKKDVRGDYESHHIKPFKQFPALKYSLGNLYPLLKEEHHTNNFIYYHKIEEARNPENWTDAAKLPHHDYEGFKFFDLNKYLLTDFIFDEDRSLFDKKKAYADQFILYFPLYYQELDVFTKAFIIYSMIRSRLAKIPEIGLDIYKYTGQKFRRFNTRKLEVKLVGGVDALNFFEETHIQGYVESRICLGLYQDALLVSAMSFGPTRSEKWKGRSHYELLRFSSLLNSSVPGAASKLFKAFVKQYDPELVVSFCDCRFSSVDPNETVYPKLGFEYDGYSPANYKYFKDGKLYSRQQFMKSKQPKRLEQFDPNLSETENMRRNGYLKLYDCGNFRYVWRKNKAGIV